MVWDASWSRRQHLLGVKTEIDGTFVSRGRYRKRKGQRVVEKRELKGICAGLRLPADVDIAEIGRRTRRR